MAEHKLCAQPHNHLAGTFPYAAPELLLGRQCNLSADIFSLGVLLHEMITRLQPQRGQMRCARVRQAFWDCTAAPQLQHRMLLAYHTPAERCPCSCMDRQLQQPC